MSVDKEEIEKLSFEQALEQLESIVESLEQGNVPLDQSIAHYERGEALRNHCRTLLSAAEDRVEKIRLDTAGKPEGREPLDPD